MKRIILSLMAISMLAATSLQGQAAPINRPAAPQAELVQVDYRKPAHGQNHQKPVYNNAKKKPAPKYDNRRDHGRYGNHHTAKKPNYAKHHDWKRGQRYSDWRRHPPVRDYQRHGLKRPAPGQQWIKVDNDYLLVGLATGLIAGVIAAR
ncbi:RcnB family protein [Aquamicrobium lusatiense]|uniref:RcnB family protein n=1 Tax=Aquamicrobium lusatiense TaxID=89772 RepID=UPI00245718F9|nr:RcnB family protein [Aquamicrobium lusatiense]MDH4990716.1 RcnB family protein [Aquamicrobium lusatiense]